MQTTTLTDPLVSPEGSFAWEAAREPWHRDRPYDPQVHLEDWQRRRQLGKALRAQTPRRSHGDWQPATDRRDPIAAIEATNQIRQPHLLPLRMQRMAASPYTFFRGTAGIMAADLARTPISGTSVMIDGDAHLGNFGLYGTPQRTVVFDLDDFDDVAYGPWEWDLKRLAASVNLAGRDRGLGRRDRRDAVMACVAGYQENANALQSLRILEVWYLHHYPERSPHFKVDSKIRKVLRKAVEKARSRTNVGLLEKVARRSPDWQFTDDPPILTRVDGATAEKVIDALVPYAETLTPERGFMFRRYRAIDVAHRVVGVGSVGLQTYLVMLLGNGDCDPLFLQVKEALPSAWAPYGPPFPRHVAHEGQRVVFGQRILQAATDVLLGWTSIDGRPFYVRQMKNMKGSIPLDWLAGSAFEAYSQACGALLARAHARSGDIAKISGYCGKSDALAEAIAKFSETYGDLAEQDFEAFQGAIAAGKFSVET